MSKEVINGIPASAPVFKGAKFEDLKAIIKHLTDASYHYADDSAKEWQRGRSHVKEAAQMCNNLGLGYEAIYRLHKHESQLVDFDQFMNAVLTDARQKGGA